MTHKLSDFAPQEPSGQPLVDMLVGLMQLEPIEVDLYRGPRTHETAVRVFGGQVIGQALMAASHTVETERLVHSLHCYFMRPGNPNIPILYQVFRDRDGKSFSSRRVVAIQDGKPILNLACSFQIREPGLDHWFEMPDVPGPETLDEDRVVALRHLDEIPEGRREFIFRPRAIEFRPVNQTARYGDGPKPPRANHWFRAVAPVGDDQVLQRALLAYASDMMLASVAMQTHGISWIRDRVQEGSLDHALWIHADAKMDDWMLYAQDSPWTGGARGMNRGLIYDRHGKLIASVAQEGLIRVPPERLQK